MCQISRAASAALIVLIASVIPLVTAGCAAQQPETPTQHAQQVEPILSAAGFHALPADTPARKAELNRLTPLKMRFFPRNGQMHYWYADPYYCNCIYSGSEKAYDTYQRLRLQQQMANQEEMSSQMNEDAAAQENMNFMMWPANEVFY
jgi:hypothetical protein